jgi:periplasmic divalent cation tolerance protein
MTDKLVVFSTCATAEEAERIGRHLVESRLAACVAVSPEQKSIYHWKGAVEDSREWGLTIKTTRGLFAELRRELCRMHSYEVPELLAVAVVDGNADYLEWMDRELKQPAE